MNMITFQDLAPLTRLYVDQAKYYNYNGIKY